MTNLVYPTPVKRCKDKVTGEMYEIANSDVEKLLSKIDEEIAEAKAAHREYQKYLLDSNPYSCMDCEMYYRDTAEEIADTITACITALEEMGYKEKERSELFTYINEKNRARGYLDD